MKKTWLKNGVQAALAVAGVFALSGQTSPAQGPPKGAVDITNAEVTTILNGPSCSGTSYGDIVSRHMGVGDISLIPEGVPHGWTDIPTEVTYLSIRPDMKKVLQHGYVNPYLNEGAGH